jgi:hypothetical protein
VMSFVNIVRRFILRDFTYDAEKISQQQTDLDVAGTSEKELWVTHLVPNFEPLLKLP